MGLWGIYRLYSINSELEYPGHEVLGHPDSYSILAAVGLAIVASLRPASIPPGAWEDCPPAIYLKNQQQ